jgi:HNH endonuclease
LACDAPLAKGRSKFCSKDCCLVKLSSRVWPKNCIACRKPFIARNPNHQTCGQACKLAYRKAYDVNRVRWKHGRRRAAQRLTDITPQQEAEMRRKARKCPLCGIRMTSKPRLPNSKELDHIVPVGMGGTHTHGNVRIICRDCNLRRPKDGSDYTGMVTLWATAPGVLVRPKPEPKAKPQPVRNVSTCACGSEFMPRRGGQRCPACIVELATQAWTLRRQGLKWEAICEQLNYSNTGSLYGLVMRHAAHR